MSKFITVVAGLITFGSAVGYFNSEDINSKKFNLNLGLITIGITAGAIAGEISKYATTSSKLLDVENKFTKEIKSLTRDKNEFLTQNKHLSTVLVDKDKEHTRLIDCLDQKKQELASYKQAHNLLEIATKKKLDELDLKIKADSDIEGVTIEFLKEEYVEFLHNRIISEYDRIGNTTEFQYQNTKYDELRNPLERFYEHLKVKHDTHLQQVGDIYSLDNSLGLKTVSKQLMAIHFQISTEIASLHVKLKNLLGATTKLNLEVCIEELEERRDPTKFVPRDKVLKGLRDFQASTEDKLALIRDNSFANDATLQEFREDINHYIDQIEARNLEIGELKHQLSLPIFWNLANSRELEIGNLIINYFWKDGKGIYLDRSHAESDGYNLTLYFQIDRNPRVVIEKELNQHSEALQQFCRVIKPIEFNYCGTKGLMSAKVVLKEKVKLEVTATDISRICKPHTKFKSEVLKYERWRITGGSQQGKSPTAQLIINALTEDRKAKNELPVNPRLFNPQFGSKKDNWSIPTEGKGDDECLQGFKTLVSEMKSRQKGTIPKNTFDLFIFDEVDSLYADTKSQEIKKAINYGNKQASHQDVGLLILGQACDANTFGQMTWSDWKSVAMLHLGDNARSYISSKWKDEPEIREEYLKQYRSIQAYYQKKNDDAGLDITSYGYFRFAFIDIPNRRPFFTEIPPFIFDEDIEQECTLPKPSVVSTNTQDIVFTNNNLPSFIDNCKPNLEENITELKCSECNSNNIGTKGAYYWRCRDCGKCWKRK